MLRFDLGERTRGRRAVQIFLCVGARERSAIKSLGPGSSPGRRDWVRGREIPARVRTPISQARCQSPDTHLASTLPESGHPFRKHGRSSQADVLREVGAQNLIELIKLVAAHAHEQESEDRLAWILDAA